METVNVCQNISPPLYWKLLKGFPQDLAYILSRVGWILWPKKIASKWPPFWKWPQRKSVKFQCSLISMTIYIYGYFEVGNWLVMMKIAFRVIYIFKISADKISKISMFSNFNENWYLLLFWSEELIGNDENCIQGHFYDATVSKMAANKIDKLLMVSDFNEHWYLAVFWSEELVGNDEICSQGHFYEATIFKMAANKIVKLSMVWFQWKLISRDFEVRNWLVPWILILGSIGDLCVCI
jgi:hypothetical protein